jgi:hypothetical protein
MSGTTLTSQSAARASSSPGIWYPSARASLSLIETNFVFAVRALWSEFRVHRTTELIGNEIADETFTEGGRLREAEASDVRGLEPQTR